MMNLREDVSFTMPCAMIQHLPFEEQIKTVKALGYQEFTLHQYYLGIYNKQGVTLKDMKSMVEDAGLKINRIDPLCTWVPEWQARKFSHEFNLLHAMEVSEFLELSAFFECDYLTLNAMWTAGHYTEDEIVNFYAEICERAGKYGITCDIEAIPMWGIPLIDDALRIINKSGAVNSGLVFDTTHITRGGTTAEQIKSIPPELIHLVQLCDGEIPSKISLEEECFSRMWPGTGDFDISGMVRLLSDMGALRNVGVEVFSPSYERDKISGEWIAEQSVKAMNIYPELLQS
ncbi:TPA: sugar phosphate isomerase/epimerase [Serratia fonticola]|nr:sugar phosphate isomerase/epimerase [Serratia fonticola]